MKSYVVYGTCLLMSGAFFVIFPLGVASLMTLIDFGCIHYLVKSSSPLLAIKKGA